MNIGSGSDNLYPSVLELEKFIENFEDNKHFPDLNIKSENKKTKSSRKNKNLGSITSRTNDQGMLYTDTSQV